MYKIKIQDKYKLNVLNLKGLLQPFYLAFYSVFSVKVFLRTALRKSGHENDLKKEHLISAEVSIL